MRQGGRPVNNYLKAKVKETELSFLCHHLLVPFLRVNAVSK
jgi:hypothetical protein